MGIQIEGFILKEANDVHTVSLSYLRRFPHKCGCDESGGNELVQGLEIYVKATRGQVVVGQPLAPTPHYRPLFIALLRRRSAQFQLL